MSRALAIDYGTVRTGLAVTDSLCMIANPLTTVDTKELWPFLEQYINKENVTTVIVGYPTHLNGELADIVPLINELITRLQQHFPSIVVEKHDERFTSKIAYQAIVTGGLKKKKRADKGLIDRISATIMLEEWLENK
ncbi:MAG: Holliday junction resolvase RuvX [Bacteroidales bacterium]|nr:Holliday junction resolvase RuvX [Bacteroidales bacterium]